MSLSITVDVGAGTSINRAATDAQRLADHLGIVVEMTFNGVKCIVLPFGSPEALAENQQAEQGRPDSPLGKLAVNRKRDARATTEGQAHD